MPELVKVIGNPEVALATTVKLKVLAALAGAGVVTTIVWLAGVALTDSVACAAAE
jgi:hypothetical protein